MAYYDLEHQLADEVAQLEAGGGASLGGDIGGTVANAIVNHVLGGQTPVSTATALVGDVTGTLAATVANSVRGGSTPLIGTDAIAGGVLGGTYAAPTLRNMPTVKATFGARGGGASFTSGGSITGAGPFFLNDAGHSPFTSQVSGASAVVLLPGAGSGGRNFSTAFTFVSASQIQLTTNPPNSGGFGGAYQFGFDDTTVINNGLASAGVLPVMWEADTYFWTTLTPKAGGTYLGHGATVYKIPGTTALFRDSTIDGVTLNAGLHIEGFNAHGEGLAGYLTSDQQAQNFVSLNQWTDVVIVRCVLDGFYNAACDVRDCQRVWYLYNKATNCCIDHGRNVLNFGDSNTGGSLPCTDFYAIGNFIASCQAEGIVIAASFRAETLTNAVITNNDVSMNSATLGCVSVEINTNATSATSRRVIIANNTLNQTSTASNQNQCCIYFADDTGAGIVNDPTKVQDYLVQGNVCTSAASATGTNGNGVLTFFASSVAVIGNILRATGTCSRCIYVNPQGSDATVMSWVTFQGNQCHGTNTGGVSNLVEIKQTNHWSYLGGIIESSSTTSGEGMKIGVCQFWNVGGGLRIETPANNGLNMATWKDGIIDGIVIYNVNGQNTASTGLGNGIIYSGTAANQTGTLNAIYNATVYDDRGTHQMLFGFQISNGTATTKCKIKGNLTITGALTLPMTSTTIANGVGEIAPGSYSSDVLTGYGLNVTTTSINAVSVTIGPFVFDADLMVTSLGTITGWTYSRNSAALGAPSLNDSVHVSRGESVTVASSGSTGTVTVLPRF